MGEPIRFISTRGGATPVPLSDAVRAGLAPDGGLYVPDTLPAAYAPGPVADLAEDATRLLEPFVLGDRLEPHIERICRRAFAIPIPLEPLGDGGPDYRLELFRGPTAAFKDFGARFLAGCARALVGEDEPATVLVATSGDTGGAVAAAFADLPGVKVWILFPEGRISDRQEAQLCSWGGPVRAFAVDGTFDDCQRIVKQAFMSDSLRQARGLTSANSINLARILPQAAYHAHAARLHIERTGEAYRPIIPTGNLGHAVAALWARAMGAPIGEVIFALNANRACADWLDSGQAEPRAAIPTIANAMDVGVPSNLERLRHRFPDPADVPGRAFSFGDAEIRDAIRSAPELYGFVPCPHTACALLARERVEDGRPWTVVATAHPAKFEAVVEPLVGPVPVPSPLAELMARPRSKTRIAPRLDALLDAV